jgi:5-carboxymethyl-2-hydroxymuconate isomerase
MVNVTAMRLLEAFAAQSPLALAVNLQHLHPKSTQKTNVVHV